MLITIGFQALRMVGLFEMLLGYVLFTCLKPSPVKEPELFQFAGSCYYGGLIMLTANSIDDLPCKEMFLPQIEKLGIMAVVFIFFFVAISLLKVILG